MKKVVSILFVVIFVVSMATFVSADSREDWIWALLEFEKSVKYEAQAASWRQKRPDWISRVKAVQRPGQVKQLLIELETSIKYSMQSANWKNRRAAWISEVRAANSAPQFGRLLLEVENMAKWEAHYPSWREKRAAWRARVRNLR